jgi:hypothetical protein
MPLVIKNSVATSQRTNRVYVTKISELILIRELITDCEKYDTHIWADSGVLNVEGCGTYFCHSPLKDRFL